MFSGSSLTPVFKRWSREISPPELYNHGFENMESIGKIPPAYDKMRAKRREKSSRESVTQRKHGVNW